MAATYAMMYILLHLVPHSEGQNTHAETFLNNITDCPFTCDCHQRTLAVVCANQPLFPVEIPKETKSFTLTSSSIPEIPLNVFQGLDSLDNILISDTTIQEIKACSFAGIDTMSTIIFNNVSINLIEANSFSNLFKIEKILFNNTNIGDIKSYAFHNLKMVNSLEFVDTEILLVEKFTFRNLSQMQIIRFEGGDLREMRMETFYNLANVSKFELTKSVIGLWQCKSLKVLEEEVNEVVIEKNSFKCDCNLLWLYQRTPKPKLFQAEASNKCGQTAEGHGKLLNQVPDSDLCPNAASGQSSTNGCGRDLLPSPPTSCVRNYDTPIKPDEEVEYPKFYTAEPKRGESHSNTASIAFTSFLYGVTLTNVILN